LKKKPPNYAVPALDRGLDILEALAASPVPLSLTDIARTLHTTASGVFRLMTRFEERAYVAKDAVSGKYSLTLKLFELSHTHSPLESLLRVAAIPMRELAESTGESVHLSVLNRGKLVVLTDVGAPGRWRISFDVGARFAAVHTNSGRLLLANLSDEERDDLLAHDEDYAAMNESERQKLLAACRRLKREGYGVERRAERGGLSDIAVLTGSPQIGVTAALAIACMKFGENEANYVAALVKSLQACAATITNALGLSQ